MRRSVGATQTAAGQHRASRGHMCTRLRQTAFRYVVDSVDVTQPAVTTETHFKSTRPISNQEKQSENYKTINISQIS